MSMHSVSVVSEGQFLRDCPSYRLLFPTLKDAVCISPWLWEDVRKSCNMKLWKPGSLGVFHVQPEQLGKPVAWPKGVGTRSSEGGDWCASSWGRARRAWLNPTFVFCSGLQWMKWCHPIYLLSLIWVFIFSRYSLKKPHGMFTSSRGNLWLRHFDIEVNHSCWQMAWHFWPVSKELQRPF